MKIYLINLTRRPDRLAKMDSALKALGLPYTRVEAVDGATADMGQPVSNKLPATGYACYLSHLKAYRAFLETPDSHCVILEDDVALSPRLPEALSASDLHTDKNAILRLEAPTNVHWRKPSYSLPLAVASQNGLASYKLLTKSYGTGAFVISREVAEDILAHQAQPTLHIDVRLFHQQYEDHLGFNILQINPALAIQRQYSEGVKDSDIMHTPPERSGKHPMQKNIEANLQRIFRILARPFGFIRRFPFAEK